MPLKHSSSKKAFEQNIKAEMHAGKPQDQSLAIAYSIKHKAKKKKMAEGGMVNESAKSEHRPMPEERDKDAKMVSRNSGDKPPMQDSWTDRPDIRQSQKGPKTTPIKHPKMVPSDAFSARLRSEEDDLQSSAGVNNGPQRQPPEHDNEEGADRQGPEVSDMEREHSNGRKPYAKGGSVMEPQDHGLEEMEREDEAHLMSSEDPSGDEGSAEAHMLNEMHPDRHGDPVPDMEREHSNGRKPYASGGAVRSGSRDMDYNEGGMIDDSLDHEEEMEHQDSIASAIMARKDREKLMMSDSDMDEMERLYEGGEVNGRDSIYSDDSDQADLRRNAEEDANMEDQASFDALRKENYSESEGLRQLDYSDDANEHGDSREDAESDPRDRVESIRRQMNMKRQFKQR